MNRIYRLIWNHKLGLVQVASEISTAKGGKGGRSAVDRRRCQLRRALVALGSILAILGGTTGIALANPAGGAGGGQNQAGGNGQGIAEGAGASFNSPAGGGGGGSLATLGYGGGGGGGGGANDSGGAGGAGGLGGAGADFLGGTLSVTGTLAGGAGAAGGNGATYTAKTSKTAATGGGGGGAGGGGGGGVFGTNFTLQIASGGEVKGGAGGAGGSASFGAGGSGGAGGVAISGSGFTVNNAGSIAGGVGGAAGGAGGSYPKGNAGNGGVAIISTGASTLIDSGSIAGGLSGAGTRANAIDLSGGNNTLELLSGYSITGNVVSTSGTGTGTNGDTLALGGSTSSSTDSFDVSKIGSQFQGFKTLAVTGGTWNLTGSPPTSGFPGWSLNGGTAVITSKSGAPLGNSVTFDYGGILKINTSGANLAQSITLNQGASKTGATGGVIDSVAGSGNTNQLSGVISGNGNLTLEATGTLVLSGANTYKGTTTIDSGTAEVQGSGLLGAGSLSVAQGAKLILDTNQTVGGLTDILNTQGKATPSGNIQLGNGVALTINAVGSDSFSGTISGTSDGGLILNNGVSAPGSLTLTGGNTYTGATSVDGGTLTVASTGTLGGGALNIAKNATVVMNESGQTVGGLAGAGSLTLDATALTVNTGSTSTTFSGQINGNGSLTVDSSKGTVLTLSGLESYTGQTVINSGGTLAIGANGSLSGSSGVTDNGSLDISGANGGAAGVSIASVSGTGTVATGAQTLTLSNAAGTFSGVISGTSNGGLNIAAGTETLRGANTYTGSTTIGTGATLVLGTGGSIAASTLVSDGGTLDLSGAGPSVSLQTLNGAGSVKLGGNTLTLSLPSSHKVSDFSGVISGSGGVELTGNPNYVAGSTTSGQTAYDYLFGGPNTYTGTTQIDTGASLALGASLPDSATVVDNGNLDLGGSSSSPPVIQSLTGSGSVSLGAAGLEVSGSGVFSGVIGGSGAITLIPCATIKPSIGSCHSSQTSTTVTLSGNNTYTGVTQIDAGATLALSHYSTTNSSGAKTTIYGGISDSSNVYVASGGTLDISGLAGASSPRAALITTLDGSGNVTLGNGNGLTLTLAGGTFSGVISGNGAFSVNTGTETLSGNNTYTGATKVDTGATLALDKTGSIASTSNLDIVNGGTLDISGLNLGTIATLHHLNGGGTVNLGNRSANLTGTSNFSGTIAGAGDVTIAPGADMTLSGDNAYYGQTTISAGSTLALAGVGSIRLSNSVIDNGTLSLGNLNAGATASIQGLQGGSATTTGVVDLGSSAGRTLLINGTASTFAGVIKGAGGVTLASGTQTLSNANLYTGATVIDTGASLNFIGAGSIADSASMTANGTLGVSSITSADFNLAGPLGGSGILSLGNKNVVLTSATSSNASSLYTFKGGVEGTGSVGYYVGTTFHPIAVGSPGPVPVPKGTTTLGSSTPKTTKTLDGQGLSGQFINNASSTVTVSNAVVEHYATVGGKGSGGGAGLGGAFFVGAGTLNISNSVIKDNSATGGAGGIGATGGSLNGLTSSANGLDGGNGVQPVTPSSYSPMPGTGGVDGGSVAGGVGGAGGRGGAGSNGVISADRLIATFEADQTAQQLAQIEVGRATAEAALNAADLTLKLVQAAKNVKDSAEQAKIIAAASASEAKDSALLAAQTTNASVDASQAATDGALSASNTAEAVTQDIAAGADAAAAADPFEAPVAVADSAENIAVSVEQYTKTAEDAALASEEAAKGAAAAAKEASTSASEAAKAAELAAATLKEELDAEEKVAIAVEISTLSGDVANSAAGIAAAVKDLHQAQKDFADSLTRLKAFYSNLAHGNLGLGGNGGTGGAGGAGAFGFGGGAGGVGGAGGAGVTVNVKCPECGGTTYTGGAAGGNGGDGAVGGAGGFGAGGGSGGDGGLGGASGTPLQNPGQLGLGGPGGQGGFGGGVGSSGKGSNGSGGGGGGGSGFGGAVFVASGANLNVSGTTEFVNNQALGGGSLNGGAAGQAAGSALFLMAGSHSTFDPGNGGVITVDGGIADNSAESIGGTSIPAGSGASVNIGRVGEAANNGLVLFNGVDTYSGTTHINAGTLGAGLEVHSGPGGLVGTGIDPFSNIDFNGGVLMTNGSNGNQVVNRVVGTAPGDVQWTGSGGFAAMNNPLTISLNNGDGLIWGQGSFVPFNSELILGSPSAAGTVTFTNAMTIGGGGMAQIGINPNATGSDTATLTGVLSGPGGLQVDGPQLGSASPALIMTVANTYTGTTRINAGAHLELLNLGSIADSSNVVDNGLFDISKAPPGSVSINDLSGTGQVSLGDNGLTVHNAAGKFSGAISGNGGLEVASGIQVLAGSNPYRGPTLIDANAQLQLDGVASIGSSQHVVDNGTLAIGASSGNQTITSLAGNGTVVLGNNTLVLSGAFDTFSGSIGSIGSSGSGGVSITGGTEQFSGNNTYTGGTSLSGKGTLLIGSDANLGASTSPVSFNGGTLVSTHSGTAIVQNVNVGSGGGTMNNDGGNLTLSGNLSGPGTLHLTGGGDTTVSGTDKAGLTSVQSGIFSLGSNGQVQGGLSLSQGVEFRPGSGTYSGSVSSAALTLLHGTPTFANGLDNTGIVTGAATIVGNVTNDGKIIVGNPTGTTPSTLAATPGGGATTIDGNLTQGAAGNLEFAIALGKIPGLAGVNTSLNVTGNIKLGGKVTIDGTAGNYGKVTYNLINDAHTGATLSGTFSGAQLVGVPGYGLYLTYIADPQVQMTLYPTAAFAPAANTANERQVAGVLDSAYRTATGALESQLNLMDAQTLAQQTNDLNRIDGELYADAPTVLATSIHQSWNPVFAPLGLSASVGPVPQRNVWISATGTTGALSGDGNANGVTHSSSGFLIGGQTQVGPGWTVGGAAGSTHLGATRNSVGDRLSTDMWQVGAFAGHALGKARMGGALGYSHGTVQFSNASMKASVWSMQGRIARTYALQQGNAVTPLVALYAEHVQLGSATESDPVLGLHMPATQWNNAGADLRVRVDHSWSSGPSTWVASGGLGLRELLTPTTNTRTMNFNSIPGQSFSVQSAQQDRSAGQVSAGLSAYGSGHLQVEFKYMGTFAAHTRDNSVYGKLVWHF